MQADRAAQILLTGFQAAHEEIFSAASLKKPEYPHDFGVLYGWAEDKLMELYDAIKQRNPSQVVKSAADVIVTMSEIVEYALTAESLERPKTKNESLEEGK